ncbi:MAG: hypothetical protein IJ198_14485 [Lachnospiraceae bacterium]|nr:hypothetical protein [Lachnospiraceae bacterium]
MTANYRTTISDKRWIAYDIPGNIGWITWLMCTVKEIREKGVIRSITAIVPAVFMLIGVCELISERIAGLDRVLPGERLFRGFGALMAGGLLGIPVSVSEFRKDRKRSGIMLIASLLCAGFAGLLFAGYKKE